MAEILIVDDDKLICEQICSSLTRMGHHSQYALTLRKGLERVASGPFDAVFLDVRLPDGNGLEAIPDFRSAPSSPEVIIITGEGDPNGAELAVRSGAWDYVEKPPSIQHLTLPLLRALQYRAQKNAHTPLKVLHRDGIIGSSIKMKQSLELLAEAASSDANVLITGETGTGKELFARAVHENSSRSERDFVVVDCASLPETLVESVLFGYEKGAYTGAEKTQEGLIKQADGGTLFLDEIGELPLPIQKSLLRVLQERRFRPVGAKKEKKSDFRLVAATNQDVDQLVETGLFRKDLLFRLRTFGIHLCPLRERKDDIKALALHHMMSLCEKNKAETKGFSPEFFEALSSYPWPGNVRELHNTLEKAFFSAGNDPILFPKHLPIPIRVRAARASVGQVETSSVRAAPDEGPSPARSLPSFRHAREAALSEIECRYMQDLMKRTNGSIKKACEVSGLGRARVYALLKKHRISTSGFPLENPHKEPA
jgi:two-component system, NtrC family, response regulator